MYVHFGNQKKLDEGIIIGFKDKSEYKLKDIVKIQKDNISENRIKLAQWMSNRYFCNLSECLKLMLPPGTGNKEETKRTKEEEKRKKEEERWEEEEAEVKILKAAIAEQAREDEQPQSSNFTLRKILGGDILSAHILRNNIWLIIVIVGFIIVYISNRYSVQKYLLEIDKLNTELEDAKYRALSSSSQLTEKSRESHILELLKNRKDSVLKMSDRPPYIINVPEK